MHPFAISIMVRTQSDGTIAAINGSTLAARTETHLNENMPFTATTLYADKGFTTSIAVQNGKFGYKPAGGAFVDSGIRADAQWHNIVLSHFTARGETLLFVDGKPAGKVAERLEPTRFVVGGPGQADGVSGPRQADYKDVFLYRAALNADEVAAMSQGKMLKGSLEVYSPLTDVEFKSAATVENRAQSLTALKVGSDRIVHMDESSATR